jgi:hypothetical protein
VDSRCKDVVCRKLLERTDHSIKEVNDVLVRLVVRTVARHIKGLSQEPRHYLTYGSARRVFAELRLDHRPLSTACRPDRTASPRVSRMRRLGSLG